MMFEARLLTRTTNCAARLQRIPCRTSRRRLCGAASGEIAAVVSAWASAAIAASAGRCISIGLVPERTRATSGRILGGDRDAA